MPKRPVALFFALTLFCTGVWAGDTSSFVDLGFSPDGKRFMFAQYGVEAKTLKPWAELFLVDVPKNSFVRDGKKSFYAEAPVIAGQDGSGALYRLISENAALSGEHKIDFLRQGLPLYISLEEGLPKPDGGAAVEFRNFDAGDSYKATLVTYTEGSGATVASSFFINVDRVLKDGSKKSYAVGTPSLKRSGVAAYRIRRAIIAPEDGSLIFVVELWKAGGKGLDVRYMVEAVRL